MMSWCSVYSAWPVLFKGEATSRVHVDDKFTTCSCYAVSSWVHCVGLQLHHSYNLWKKLLISLGPTIWFSQNHSAGQCSSSTKDHQTVTLTSSHGYQQGTHTTNKITANRWHHMDINGTHTTRDWQDYCQQVTSFINETTSGKGKTLRFSFSFLLGKQMLILASSNILPFWFLFLTG